MSSQEEKPDLSDMDKYILDSLWKRLPQDKIWLDNFENRLRKLERMRLVEKKEDFWSLTKRGATFLFYDRLLSSFV